MKLYNTLTRKKDEFKPRDNKVVKMYACGPTVYNYIHVGNARPAVIFDTLRRYLKFKGYEVKYVVNFTDIDDKIINRANEENKTIKDISEKYIEEYLKDVKALNVLESETIHPKATEHVDNIISFIEELEDKGFAYNINGNVYFDTTQVEDYGKLSKKNIQDLISGARVDINEEKKNLSDFVLWKNKKENEPYWESPWGQGRPGWHIECSVMAKELLGETIDIHAGGEDLIFPHHENEIAQSESHNGKQFSLFWLHNGMINVDNKKMSKSLNNFFTVRDVSKEYDLEVLRFFIISGHYRKPINYSRETIKQAEASLNRLYNTKRNLEFSLENSKKGNKDLSIISTMDDFKTEFERAMDDDLNTADGLTALFEIAKFINLNFDESTSYESVKYTYDIFMSLADVLGILYKNENKKDDLSDLVKDLINKRETARNNKDYQEADKIRNTLQDLGIEIEDTKDGTKWHKV